MEPIEYLKIVRQRWRLVVGCTLLAMVVGYLLAPSGQSSAAPASAYQAEVVLLMDSTAKESFNLEQAAFVATLPDVAKVAAQTLQFKGDPAQLASEVTATPQVELALLTIAATDSNPEQAKAKATAFAAALPAVLKAYYDKRASAAEAAAQREVDRVQAAIGQLESRGGAAADAQRKALAAALQQANARLGDAQRQASQNIPLGELGEPTVTTASEAGGISAPSSRTGRMLLVGIIGLFLGVLAALVLERLDTRLRTATAIAEAFGMPVIAEIPKASRHIRHHEVAVISNPAGGLAESYRGLRSALLLMSAPRTRSEDGTPIVGRRGAPQVLLVTSPRSGDGKSSTVANLAAALAEAGRSVLVLDCDFRNPEAHRYLDVQPGIGLSDLLAAGPGADLTPAMRQTAIPHVRVITAGTATSHPASLLLRIGSVIEKARSHADLILLDSAPLLSINDTTDLVQHADAVLVVARSGRVNADQAARVTQLLSRATTPVLGIALVGTPGSGGAGRGGSRPNSSSAMRNQPYRAFSPARPTMVNRTRVRVGRWVRQIGRSDPLDALDGYGANNPPAERTPARPTPIADSRPVQPRRRVGEAPRPPRPAGGAVPGAVPGAANGAANGRSGGKHSATAPRPTGAGTYGTNGAGPNGVAPNAAGTTGGGPNGAGTNAAGPNGIGPDAGPDRPASQPSSDSATTAGPSVVPTSRPRGPIKPTHRRTPRGPE